MKKLLFLTILAIWSNLLLAQAPQDTIEIKKNVFVQNGKFLRPKQLLKITRTNPEALKFMQKARKNNTSAIILGAIGGYGIGLSLGGLAVGIKMNWQIFGIGAGFTAASVPFYLGYDKNAKTAVIIYNQGLQKTSYRKVQWESTVNANGIGIKARF